MIEMLLEIAKLSPLIALLVMKEERDDCAKIITELNKELRDNEVDNLNMINKLTLSLSQIASSSESTNKEIGRFLEEIKLFKELVMIKIDSLK
jgi:hypothetical protein